jgi:hypothetical protein
MKCVSAIQYLKPLSVSNPSGVLQSGGMVAIRGHFDGKVIVPDEPVDLRPGQRVRVHPEPVGAPGESLLSFAGSIEPDDLKLIAQAIREGCEGVDADAW